jgi:RNA polymerase sigma factor (sigma-70 family)
MAAFTHDELRKLFRDCAPKIEQVLYRKVGCRAAAADLTQDAFVRLVRHARTETILDLRAFLFRTALNLAVDYLRKERRRHTDLADVSDLMAVPDDTPTAEDSIVAQQKLEVLRQAIAELSPLCQQIFDLNRLQGFTHAEVARRLSISESTVQKNLARALFHAMRRLQERS